MNLHTSIFFRLVKLGIKAYVPFTAEQIPLPSIAHDSGYPTRPMACLGPDGVVPVIDEDVPTRPPALKMIINLNNRLTPQTDRYTPWGSREEGAQYLTANFGHYTPESRVSWNGQDATGDTALAWWATAGFGAIELKRLDARTAEAERKGHQIPCLVSSYEFLKDLPVRPGLASYGGAVYLDDHGKVIKIKLRGKDVLPSDGAAWEEAKFVYRSTSMFWCTLYHHLFYTHYIVSNNGVLATIRNLPTDNPLRLLMKPFVFRTAAINNGGMDSLLPQGSILHRASGFTWGALQEAFSMMQKMHAFEPLSQSLQQRGLDSAGMQDLPADIFPYGRDGELFWKSLNGFSTDVLTNAPAFKDIIKDDHTKAWWDQMNTRFAHSGRDLSEEPLVHFLSQFFFTVTAFHSWVGHVTPYVLDPGVAAGKLYPGKSIADQQSSLELSVIASVTGLPTPELMGDFSHLMPDDYSRGSLQRFHEQLRTMSSEIEQRNATRAIPLNAFLPDEMNLSVAI